MSKSDEAFDQAAQHAKLVGPERRVAYKFFEAGRAYQKEQDLAAVGAYVEDPNHKSCDDYNCYYCRQIETATEIARRIKE